VVPRPAALALPACQKCTSSGPNPDALNQKSPTEGALGEEKLYHASEAPEGFVKSQTTWPTPGSTAGCQLPFLLCVPSGHFGRGLCWVEPRSCVHTLGAKKGKNKCEENFHGGRWARGPSMAHTTRESALTGKESRRYVSQMGNCHQQVGRWKARTRRGQEDAVTAECCLKCLFR